VDLRVFIIFLFDSAFILNIVLPYSNVKHQSYECRESRRHSTEGGLLHEGAGGHSTEQIAEIQWDTIMRLGLRMGEGRRETADGKLRTRADSVVGLSGNLEIQSGAP
jgi:hypothetical protein